MRRRILLADDSVTIQKVIELTFLDEDYEVKAVSNGDEAIAALPQVNPDFVIADVHMPGANGYEVCRRSKELRPEIPVLLLVGTFEPFDEGQSRAVGADSFLKKPFDSQELLQRVEELLASRSAAPAAPAAAPVAADLLAMPGLSELPAFPGLDSPAPATDWGSFDLEPSPATEPFPTQVPFPVDAHPDDRLFTPAAGSSYDETPFPLMDEEPSRDGALRVDESALLPAGEVLFDFDATPVGTAEEAPPVFATPSFDAAPISAPEPFEAPPFEPASFEPPAFEPPSFATPSFDAPAFDEPAFETPTFAVPSFDQAPPAGEPEPFESVPSFEAPSYDYRAAQSDTLRLNTNGLAETGLAAPPAAPPPFTPEPPAPVFVAPEPAPEPEPVAEAYHEAPAFAEAPAAPVAAVVPPAAPAAEVAAPAVAGGNGHLSDEDVDRIARRVVELMADRAIRDVAWEVIPDMAEMVIRDRLRELESQAESFE